MAQVSGKVALITGGSSGIGRAAALAFAREGAKVVIAGRRVGHGEEAAHEVTAAGGQALFVRADVSRPGEVEGLVARAVEVYGRLDCAFNNAAAAAEAEAQLSGMVPLGRIGSPEEAAEAAVWLCSEAASYVTGHSMIVDGGLTAWAR